MEPVCSICTTTYNHRDYLDTALQSFMDQQCAYPYEILVHDDCSTDGTADILRSWAQRYPDIILPLYEEQNQYSQNIPINETFNFPRARGRYIALCEGDDYWCDMHKLQRQIDFMEAHPECTFCFTNATIHDVSGVKEDRDFLPYYESEHPYLPEGDAVLTLSDVAMLSFIPTASFLFRTDTLRSLPSTFHDHMCQHGDLRMKLYLTAAGKAAYIDMKSCVYRENVAGSAFQVWKTEKRTQLYNRCATVVQLTEDVDAYSNGTAHDALWTVRGHYLDVMAHNTPSLRALCGGDMGKHLRKMPLKEQALCVGRLLLPEKAGMALSKLRARKGAAR